MRDCSGTGEFEAGKEKKNHSILTIKTRLHHWLELKPSFAVE